MLIPRIKAFAQKANERFFGGKANVVYEANLSDLENVVPAISNMAYEAAVVPSGTIAALWRGTKVAIVSQTGEVIVLERGRWRTYYL